jgi:tRNA A22 N-methylase
VVVTLVLTREWNGDDDVILDETVVAEASRKYEVLAVSNSSRNNTSY